jgi:hypothetical protein
MYYGSTAQVESYGDFHLLSSKANPLLPPNDGSMVWSLLLGITRGIAIYIKKELKAKKKNYGNSNIFHHAKL